MHAILLPNCRLGFPRKSIFSDKATEGSFRCSLLNLTEIADGALFFASRRQLIQSSVLSIRSEGNRRGRPPRRNSASDRAAKDDGEQKVPQLPDGDSSESSSQEEIIALFRRIQSSISKGRPTRTKKRSSSSSKEKKSAESILDVLNQYPSRRQLRDKSSNKDDRISRRTAASRKEPRKEEDSVKEDIKLSRPPSNFVKRSPIPSPTAPKERVDEASGDGLPAAVAVKYAELQRVDGLKLVELKELAKSRGVKGYSKLKKGELVELLKGIL